MTSPSPYFSAPPLQPLCFNQPTFHNPISYMNEIKPALLFVVVVVECPLKYRFHITKIKWVANYDFIASFPNHSFCEKFESKGLLTLTSTPKSQTGLIITSIQNLYHQQADINSKEIQRKATMKGSCTSCRLVQWTCNIIKSLGLFLVQLIVLSNGSPLPTSADQWSADTPAGNQV